MQPYQQERMARHDGAVPSVCLWKPWAPEKVFVVRTPRQHFFLKMLVNVTEIAVSPLPVTNGACRLSINGPETDHQSFGITSTADNAEPSHRPLCLDQPYPVGHGRNSNRGD